jgi:hypothetical protein
LQNDPQPSQTPTDGWSDCCKEPPQDLPVMDAKILNEITQQNVEILEVLQQSEIILDNPQHRIASKPSVEISSQGKNIEQMKAIYNSEKKPAKPSSRKRKRKEPEQNKEENEKVTVVVVGPGRPSKDEGLLRDAQNEEDSNNDDESIYAFREVLLLTGNGTIRKKTKLLTKQSDRDMRCFAIKHFPSLEYIAEKKKKSFAIIKKERQKLKTLNYLELNTVNDMKEINNM